MLGEAVSTILSWGLSDGGGGVWRLTLHSQTSDLGLGFCGDNVMKTNHTANKQQDWNLMQPSTARFQELGTSLLRLQCKAPAGVLHVSCSDLNNIGPKMGSFGSCYLILLHFHQENQIMMFAGSISSSCGVCLLSIPFKRLSSWRSYTKNSWNDWFINHNNIAHLEGRCACVHCTGLVPSIHEMSLLLPICCLLVMFTRGLCWSLDSVRLSFLIFWLQTGIFNNLQKSCLCSVHTRSHITY